MSQTYRRGGGETESLLPTDSSADDDGAQAEPQQQADEHHQAAAAPADVALEIGALQYAAPGFGHTSSLPTVVACPVPPRDYYDNNSQGAQRGQLLSRRWSLSDAGVFSGHHTLQVRPSRSWNGLRLTTLVVRRRSALYPRIVHTRYVYTRPG